MNNQFENLIDSALVAKQGKKSDDGFHPVAPAVESAASIFARRRAEAQAWRPGVQKTDGASPQLPKIDATAIFAARREQTQRAVIAHAEEIE